MRSYGKYQKNYEGKSKGSSKNERKERLANEWDIRIDCDQEYADTIMNNLNASASHFDYALLSGIERPDHNDIKINAQGSSQDHVHIALKFKWYMRRDQVLAFCRGLTKSTDEYAAPRNRKFTYAGWYLHHAKSSYKLEGQPDVMLELGELPRDPVDPVTVKEVKRMMDKFGSNDPSKTLRFSEWLSQPSFEDECKAIKSKIKLD